jgi:putative tryptophan/tyrosine transport system substrate-binding protein
MRRRTLHAILGGSVVAWLHPGLAQPGTRVIGVLVYEGADAFLRQFAAALREFGHVDGHGVRVEMRSAEGNETLLPGLAAELVRLKVDVIVARLTPAVLAASQATAAIPIVMAGAGDPVATGLVDSLARPGRNVTGVAGAAAQLAGKLVEIIRDMMPGARRVAVLANPTDRFTPPFLDQIRLTAQALNLEISVTMIRDSEEFPAVFTALSKNRPDALIVQPSLPRSAAAAHALAHRLPAFSPIAAFAAEGGLMGYYSNEAELYRQTALYVDKILKGSKPADLPVTQSSRFDLVINLRTANAIGMSIPPTLLVRADSVIE